MRDEYGVLRSSLILAATGDSQVRIVGTDQGNRGAIAADDAAAVEALADGVHRSLFDRPPGETVVLGPVDARHPHTQMFSAALPGSTLLEDDPIPLIRNQGLALTDYLSNGMRRQLRKARNRLETDELTWSVAVTTDPDEIRNQLPVLERCHRERDHAHGRASALDDEHGLHLSGVRIEGLPVPEISSLRRCPSAASSRLTPPASSTATSTGFWKARSSLKPARYLPGSSARSSHRRASAQR